MLINKSNYKKFRACPRKLYYLLNNDKEARPATVDEQHRINEGFEIGKEAYNYFSNTVCVKKDPNDVNIEQQILDTKKLLKDNVNCIAEASFIYEDLFCAVDLLVKSGNGYSIYEVKSSKNIKKNLDNYSADVAFQKYVLQKCGLIIENCYILYPNGEYVRKGDINPKKLFTTFEIEKEKKFQKEYESIDSYLEQLRQFLKNKNLPNYGKCKKDCPFFKFCHKDLPTPNILELNHMYLKEAHEYINEGIITLADFKKIDYELNNYQKIQLQTENKPHIDKVNIANWLQTKLKYPLYHLDFETTMKAVPPLNGLKPWQTIAFQFSLHIESKSGVEPEHKEFLANKYDDEYALAQNLIKYIPPNACVVAFHVSTERSVIEKLAERFPELSEKLLALTTNMVDLLEPFTKGYYYNPIQHGINSIKAVMPAMCPEIENSYNDLPLVHNGGQAMVKFIEMLKMSGTDLEKTRKGMLEYCKLDTYSMVKVLEKLKKLCK